MTAPNGIWFVFRAPNEGPLSKRVRRLSAPSILSFFQVHIDEARTSLAPRDVGKDALGGAVPGLGDFFEAVKADTLHTPKTMVALRKMLREHHAGEGEVNLQADDHSLRVLTAHEGVPMAYFFFDDEAAKKSPERFAFLLHETTSLPDGGSEAPFTLPVEMRSVTPRGPSDGATYACFLNSADHHSPVGEAVVFPGVRLPELAAHLVRTDPDSSEGTDGWPMELRLLRVLLEEGDTTLGAALGRVSDYPIVELEKIAPTLGLGTHAAARAEFLALEGVKAAGEPAAPVVHVGAHVAMLCAGSTARSGREPWVLFDDRWAAARPDLATSIARSAVAWDPCASLRAPRPSKAPKEAKPKEIKDAKDAKDAKPAEPKDSKTPARRASALKAQETAQAAKNERAWKAAIAGRTEDDARAYASTERFEKGSLLSHVKFGLGWVSDAHPTKCEVLFSGGPRVLIHNVQR